MNSPMPWSRCTTRSPGLRSRRSDRKGAERLRLGGAARALRPKTSRSVSTRRRGSFRKVPADSGRWTARHPAWVPKETGSSYSWRISPNRSRMPGVDPARKIRWPERASSWRYSARSPSRPWNSRGGVAWRGTVASLCHSVSRRVVRLGSVARKRSSNSGHTTPPRRSTARLSWMRARSRSATASSHWGSRRTRRQGGTQCASCPLGWASMG